MVNSGDAPVFRIADTLRIADIRDISFVKDICSKTVLLIDHTTDPKLIY